MKYFKILLPLVIVASLFAGCKKGGVKEFLFPVAKDVALGQQLADNIAANPAEYPIVDSATNSALYQEVYKVRDAILASGEVVYAEDFAWQIKIIDDDQTLNAFAAPGGFIYVYTGIMLYLDELDHFAGVMGHELAHADRRHSTNQLIKNSGVQLLLEVALGESSQGTIGQLAQNLVGLSFSRSDEADADEWSVKYLCSTQYESNGAAGFFQKIIDNEGTASTPEFLSTHPSPDNRVENINEDADELGCTAEGDVADWATIQDLVNNIAR